jgi:hypothetical protein
MSRAATAWSLKAAALIILLLSALYVRVIVESHRSFARGEEALRNADVGGAVAHFETGASWEAPFNPMTGKARERLWQIGRKAELDGDMDLALAAYRALRSSIMAARSFMVPDGQRLAEVDRRISALMARSPSTQGFKGKSLDGLRRLHIEALAVPARPASAWLIVLLSGFVLWTGAVAYFLLAGLGPALTIARPPCLRSLAAFLAGLALWIAGMVMA